MGCFGLGGGEVYLCTNFESVPEKKNVCVSHGDHSNNESLNHAIYISKFLIFLLHQNFSSLHNTKTSPISELTKAHILPNSLE